MCVGVYVCVREIEREKEMLQTYSVPFVLILIMPHVCSNKLTFPPLLTWQEVQVTIAIWQEKMEAGMCWQGREGWKDL